MKILIANDCGRSAHYYERVGLAKALTACNHEVIIWDIDKKSEYDAFDEFEPDIFVGQTYKINTAIIECLKERPAMKVIMKAGEFGKSVEDINHDKYPILVATENEKHLVNLLKEETDKPDLLSVHYHPDYINYTHGLWNIPTVSLMNAADIFSFTNGVPLPQYECDIMFLGGYWGYKSQVLNEWLLPLCEDFKYKIKIFGNSPWPCPQYCGFLPEGEEANALASAKICINLHEPHSQEYGYDVVERPFKLASNKCFMMSDSVEGLERAFSQSYKNGYLNTYQSPEDMFYHIYLYLTNWNNYSMWMNESKQSLYKETLEKHTYFDRAYTLFKNLDLNNQAEDILKSKKDILKRMDLV